MYLFTPTSPPLKYIFRGGWYHILINVLPNTHTHTHIYIYIYIALLAICQIPWKTHSATLNQRQFQMIDPHVASICWSIPTTPWFMSIIDTVSVPKVFHQLINISNSHTVDEINLAPVGRRFIPVKSNYLQCSIVTNSDPAWCRVSSIHSTMNYPPFTRC